MKRMLIALAVVVVIALITFAMLLVYLEMVEGWMA